VLDQAILTELRDLGATEFIHLVEMFLEDGAVIIQDLLNARRVGRTTEIAGFAHSLKGGAGVFGAVGLVGQCAELETRFLECDFIEQQRIIDGVTAKFHSASEALRCELALEQGLPRKGDVFQGTEDSADAGVA